MVAEIKEGVMEALTLIADKLGVATEFIWPILLKQARIEGLYGAFYIIVGLIVNILISRYVIRFVKREWNGLDDDYEDIIWVSFLMLIPVFVISIVIIANMGSILTAIFNPEWYVIENILAKVVGQLK